MKVTIHENSVYAPIRYEATRRYARRLGRLFMAHANRGAASRLRFVGNELLDLVREEVSHIGKQDGPGPAQAEIVNVQVFGEFDAGGRIIFDVARPLTESLLMTDAADIPCGELVFPAERFYLHFGVGSGLQDESGEFEGAFVQHVDEALHIDLVPAGFGQRFFFSFPMGEPLVGVRIDLSEHSRTILSALDKSITNTLEANRETFAKMAELEAQLTAKYGQVVKVPLPVEHLGDKELLLRAAVQLVVNFLFYFAAEPDDVKEGWAADAPHTLIDQVQDFAAKPGARKTAENSLKNMGYLKVRYVGTKYGTSSEARRIGEAVSTGRVLSTHIRRGHFRRQPYGQDRALRKTIFVAPVVVNVDRAGDSPGRIYEA